MVLFCVILSYKLNKDLLSTHNVFDLDKILILEHVDHFIHVVKSFILELIQIADTYSLLHANYRFINKS